MKSKELDEHVVLAAVMALDHLKVARIVKHFQPWPASRSAGLIAAKVSRELSKLLLEKKIT